jgi:hypothetical protein
LISLKPLNNRKYGGFGNQCHLVMHYLMILILINLQKK